MPQPQDSAQKTKPRSSCFLGCLGFSMKVSEKISPENVPVPSGRRKKARWSSWRGLLPKKSGAKTVPVDTTVSEKTDQSKEIPATKSDKLSSKHRIPANAAGKPPSQIPAVTAPALNQTIMAPPQTQKTRYGPAQSTILENRKHSGQLDSLKDDTCQKTSRKTEAKSTAGSHPGSPETKPKPSRTAVISYSTPFPARNAHKQSINQSKHSQVTVKDRRREINEVVNKFEPVIGMSIIVVTLLIMLLWGRLCAILCTSAWCYFIPRLRKTPKSNDFIKKSLSSSSSEPDLSSEEYKKKVVLEGFLERNHRIGTFGAL